MIGPYVYFAGWISSAVGHYCSKQQMVQCLKNVAILHAKFWGDQDIGKFKVCKTDKDYRPARYNKGGIDLLPHFTKVKCDSWT